MPLDQQQLLRIGKAEPGYFFPPKPRHDRGLVTLGSDGRLFHVFRGGQHFLGAPGQTIYFFRFGRTALMVIKRRINPPKYGFKRYTSVFPGFNQGPIQRGKQQPCSATALETLFDLGEIIEIVFHGSKGRLTCHTGFAKSATLTITSSFSRISGSTWSRATKNANS